MIVLVDDKNNYTVVYMWMKQLQKLFMLYRMEIKQELESISSNQATRKSFRKLLSEHLAVHNDHNGK